MSLRSPLSIAALCIVAVGCAPSAPPAEPAPAPEPALPFVAGFTPDSFVVRLITTKGEIDAVVRSRWAPNGAARAYETFATGYYDGARFFRTIRGFVAQFGIAADSAKSAQWLPRNIDDDPVTESNRRGTLVYAAGATPNTRSVQLFFNLRDNARLDAFGFSPIGEVIRGLDVMDALHTDYSASGPGPDQGRLTREGETYLAAEFPLLDKILEARVIRVWPAPPPTT